MDGPTPAWDEWLARVDYPLTFKAFVWSVFEPRNIGRQALWIRGEGSDGKSSAINAISSFLGRDHVMAVGKGTYDSDFFFSQAFGRRMAVYMDCKNLSILRYERIKSLLGRDTVTINKKHEHEFAAQVYCKMFVLSNFYPKINYNDNSERSRLLMVQVASYTDEFGDPDFEYNLEKEFPSFLFKCRLAYESECPNNVNFKVPKDMVLNIKAHCTAKESTVIEEFLRERLEYKPGSRILKLDMHEELEFYLREWKVKDSASFIDEDFGRIIKVRYGVSLKVDKDSSIAYYDGVSFKQGRFVPRK